MLGAIIGDMAGSIYESSNEKAKDIGLIDYCMRMTDDSLLTIAVSRVLMKFFPFSYEKETIEEMQQNLVKEFVLTWFFNQNAGFGKMFTEWCIDVLAGKGRPYNSFGNGAAMRISPVGWMAKSEEEVKKLSRIVTEITHNHPEGIKGAEAVAMAIYLALHGASKKQIKERMIKDYYPKINSLDFDDLKEHYSFWPICQESVPQAIYCFLISNSVEEAIKNCIAIGGDCDTTAAIAGSIAEAFYQKDKLSDFEIEAIDYLIDPETEKIIKDFHKIIKSKKFSQ